MRTAKEMDDFARENGYFPLGNTALKHFKVIEKNLLPDEDVWMSLASASLYNGNSIIMGGQTAVVFTNKRLICAQKAILMGEPVKIINLDNINDIEKDVRNFSIGMIYIDTLKEKVGMKFPKTMIDRIFVNILQIIEKYKATTNVSNPSSNVSNVVSSAADEIKKFKDLLDNGIITQEEFDAKKKQLLGL